MCRRIAAFLLVFAIIFGSFSAFAEEDSSTNVKVAEAAFGTPVIDGEIDNVWNNTNYNVIDTVLGSGGTFYKGWFKVLWDNEKLYMLAKVYSEQFSNINTAAWENDSIEYFVDEDCGRTTTYKDDDYQLRIGFDSHLSAGHYKVDSMEGKSIAYKDEGYYIAELAIPYKTVTPYDGMKMGFEVQVNASKTVAYSRTLYTWNIKSGSPQINTSTHGTLVLKKSVNVTKFNEPTYSPRRIDAEFYGVSREERVLNPGRITTSFDGKEYEYPVILVDEYPSMEIGDLASVIGGTAEENTLTVGDVKLTYTENSRLAVYGDGHIMLERSPKVVDGRLYVPISSLIPTTGWTAEYKRFENRIVIETGTNYPEPELTVYVKDYGAVGDGIVDDKEAILAAFNAAAGSGRPVKLEFEEGKTYRVSEKQDAFALFDLDNISNFTLEGNNSTIMFERPTNSLVNIDGSTNIKFNNINVDYEEPVTIWGRVTSIDSNDGSFIMEIPEGSPLPADHEWATYWNPGSDGPYAFGQFMDAQEDRLKFLTFDHIRINNVTHVSGRDYKVTHNSKSYMSQVEPGDRFVYKSRWTAYDFGEFDKYGRPCFLTVTHSKDVTFDGVKTNGSLLMFAPVSYNDGRIIFRNCELVLKPGTLITINADGVHAVSNRFGVIIENCIFRNSLDDFINTNQYSGNVTRIINDYTFEVDREIFYRVGDEIRFFDKINHKVIDSGFLKSVKSTGAGKYILTIDRPIKSVVSSQTSDSATLVYNMSASNNGDIIKNNKFYNSRRHVCLLRSANALFENNYMENNGGAAIEACNSIYQNTNEGLLPSSLTMRGNTYIGDGITSINRPIKVFSANAQNGEQAAIDGVLIENNIIDVPSVEDTIMIRDVSGLYMLNNTVKSGDKLKDTAVPVLIENSAVKAFDGLKYDVAEGTSVVVKLMSCDVEEDNINNINSIGANTTEPYIMEKKNIINK